MSTVALMACASPACASWRNVNTAPPHPTPPHVYSEKIPERGAPRGAHTKNIYKLLKPTWLLAFFQQYRLKVAIIVRCFASILTRAIPSLWCSPCRWANRKERSQNGNHGGDLRMKFLNKILQTSCAFFPRSYQSSTYLLQSNMMIIYRQSYMILYTHIFKLMCYPHVKFLPSKFLESSRHFGVWSRCFSFSLAHGLQLRGRGASWVRLP